MSQKLCWAGCGHKYPHVLQSCGFCINLCGVDFMALLLKLCKGRSFHSKHANLECCVQQARQARLSGGAVVGRMRRQE